MKPPQFPLERVEWLDHVTDHGWNKPGELSPDKTLEVISVGYVVEETPHSLSLASHISDEGYYLCPLRIHKRLILSRTVLRKGRG